MTKSIVCPCQIDMPNTRLHACLGVLLETQSQHNEGGKKFNFCHL